MMQSDKPLSVIFNGSVDANQASIRELVQRLSNGGRRIDITVVDPSHCATQQPSRLLDKIYVKIASTFGDAAEMAYFQSIAIVYGQTNIDPARINAMIDRLNSDVFFCDYQRVTSATGYKRGMIAANRVLNRVLLKSEVCQFDNAVLLFRRTEKTIAAVRDAEKPFVQSTQRPASASQLISGLKSAGEFHVVSAQDPFVPKQKLKTKINSKAIRGSVGETVRCWFNGIMFPQIQSLPKRQSSPTRRALKVGSWILLCLIAALMLNQNLQFALFEPDEARNVQVSLNMLDTGNWMALELKNEHYWDKPPLVAWLTAISFKTFGITSNAARFPGVVVTFLTVILTCAIGQRLIGFRAAWMGGLLTLLSLGVPFSGRYVTMDSTLTMLATVTSLAVYRGSFGRRFRQSWWVLAGVCVGLGLITKGPVILVLCGVPAIAFSWLTQQPVFKTAKQSLYFVVPASLIGVPWFLATAIGSPGFLKHFFWQHHIVRFTEGISHQQPIWFYVPVILLLMFPASQLFLPLAKFLSTRKPAVRSLRTRAHGYLFLSAVWVLVFFTCSQAKLPTYILPAVPMLCLLMASVIDINVFAKLDPVDDADANASPTGIEVVCIDDYYRRLPKWFALNMAGWAAVLSAAILFWLPTYAATVWVMIGSTVALVIATVVASHKRSHPYVAWASVGAIALFVTAMLVNQIIPAIANSRSIQMAVKELKTDKAFSDSPVVYFARDSFATSMTLGDQEVVYFSKDEAEWAANFLRNHPQAILVAATEYVDELVKLVKPKVGLTKQPSIRHVYLAAPAEAGLNKAVEVRVAKAAPDSEDADAAENSTK